MNHASENLDQLPSDDQLVSQTIGGDRGAFGLLIKKYHGRLFNAMVHLMRNEADAEDVVQDAFVLALTKLDTFKGNSQFYTWLFRITRNAAISKLRRKRPNVSYEQGAAEGSFQFPDDGDGPSAEMERQEDARLLHRLMGQLSTGHREVLVLREMEGMGYEAISEVLDLPIGTVRSRLHRAREQLRDLLESEQNPET